MNQDEREEWREYDERSRAAEAAKQEARLYAQAVLDAAKLRALADILVATGTPLSGHHVVSNQVTRWLLDSTLSLLVLPP